MAPEVRLNSIEFVAGARDGDEPTKVDVGPVTVFVGPNNSGKSFALREVFSWANQGSDPPQLWPGGAVIGQIRGAWPTNDAELDAYLGDRLLQKTDLGERIIRYFSPSTPTNMPGGGGTHFARARRAGEDFEEFCRTRVLPGLTTLLDGKSRFALAEPRQMTNLRAPATSHLMSLVIDGAVFAAASNEISEVFHHQLVVDTTNPPNLSLALSDAPPPPGSWAQRVLDPEVIECQQAAAPISTFSDGVQIYTGLVTAVESAQFALMLIDEPEAFLHPTLARRLGGRLARRAREQGSTLLAATHSADFLLGCVAEVPTTTIVRLTYEQGVATARPLAGDAVAELVRDPLLRSVDALGALFARAAVVCEADSDRAVYEEVNRRLSVTEGRSGIPDCVFLNAQNWQTIPKIAGPLRRLGIPAAVVVDLDTVASDAHWDEFAAMAAPDTTTRDRIASARLRARDLVRDAGRLGTGEDSVLRCKVDGVAAVDDKDRRAELEAALSVLEAHGIFAVPVGELENWLQDLGIPKNKKTWVTSLLTRLGSRGSALYVEPGNGDIWSFGERVASWVNNPARSGMP